MKYNVGDYVRIKTPQELRGVRVQGGSAIDKWQNKICKVTSIRPTIAGGRYKLAFCEPPRTHDDEYAARVHISQYMWEEFELELIESSDIKADVEEEAYEALLGGVQ